LRFPTGEFSQQRVFIVKALKPAILSSDEAQRHTGSRRTSCSGGINWTAPARQHDIISNATKPEPKRQALQDWFSGPEGPLALFVGRVLTFDDRAGLIWARLMAEGTAKGRLRSALDMIIAAIAEANECVVVTDNEKDFAGLKIVNALRAPS
jgi:predicted nucleic acid-binding protein